MTKTALKLTLLAGAHALIIWATVTCPFHPWATCYDTGERGGIDMQAHRWACSCGESIWIR
jgi:hypothetical protein